MQFLRLPTTMKRNLLLMQLRRSPRFNQHSFHYCGDVSKLCRRECVCVWVCMNVCVCVCVCVWSMYWASLCLCPFRIAMCEPMCVRARVYVCVCVRVSVLVCVCECMYSASMMCFYVRLFRRLFMGPYGAWIPPSKLIWFVLLGEKLVRFEKNCE